MNRYVVAFMDFFENNLQMKIFLADSELEALVYAAGCFGLDIGNYYPTSVEDFKDWAFDCDCAINVILVEMPSIQE